MAGQNPVMQLVRSLDPRTGSFYGAPFREEAAIRAEEARQRQIAGIVGELRGKMEAQNPDYGSIAKSMASMLGNNPVGRNVGIRETGDDSVEDIMRILEMRTPTARRNQEELILSAAENAPRGPVARGYDLLSRKDWQGRTAQTVYGAGLIGGVGGGMTAAGAGLMALMDYLQQGQVAQAERENELV